MAKFNEHYKEETILYLCYLYSQTSTIQTCEDWAEWKIKSLDKQKYEY